MSATVLDKSHKSRMALEELREFAELRLRAADKELLSRGALERLAAARAANLLARSRSIRAMALYVGARGMMTSLRGSEIRLVTVAEAVAELAECRPGSTRASASCSGESEECDEHD